MKVYFHFHLFPPFSLRWGIARWPRVVYKCMLSMECLLIALVPPCAGAHFGAPSWCIYVITCGVWCKLGGCLHKGWLCHFWVMVLLWIRCWGRGIEVVVSLSLSPMCHSCLCLFCFFSFSSCTFLALACFLPSLNGSPNLPITSSLLFSPVRLNIILSHPVLWMYFGFISQW